ncbi:MAG: prepilin-type N-terminal cleavage/methylation domain-containing protein [Candidatus Dadabacteria bacterium]|nr:MAG: prepilin-type N-terminal cleavage/methylation domain-containing protein [Candidatus Dadabacteria bacterium]
MKRIPSIRDESGLTLIEIMIVLVILAVLMTFLGSKLFGAGDKAKANITNLKIKELGAQIELFRQNYNRLPQSLEDLTKCTQVTGPNCVPILEEDSDLLKDGWGNPFIYTLENSGRTYKIQSLGADGKPGGTGVNSDFTGTGP